MVLLKSKIKILTLNKFLIPRHYNGIGQTR